MAISKDGNLLDLLESNSGKTHASDCSVFTGVIMERNKLGFSDLGAVAVSSGPGSYTGLRIGVSMAKGICYATGKPLIAVSTLDALVDEQIESDASRNPGAWYCPMIDARRMEVFLAMYDGNGKRTDDISAEIIHKDSFADILQDRKIIFFGTGSEKCREVINNPHAIFIKNRIPSAKNMIRLSWKEFNNNNFQDVAYFEPYYLKDFIATIPKRKVI